MKKNILSVFQEKKPIIGVIHCKGDTDADVLERAKREIDIYRTGGVDGVLVETYFGTYHNVEQVLGYLQKEQTGYPYGVNCLNVDAMGFVLAQEFGCDYLQIDSVGGHLKSRDDETLDAFFKYFREKCDAYLMGGVRFKYQPVNSGRSTEEDLKICMNRCDAICVTEDDTGQETSMKKIEQFRNAIGKFPLIVCAGMTAENVEEQLKVADAGVVGSYFKVTYKDTGDVSAEHVKNFMERVRILRDKIND